MSETRAAVAKTNVRSPELERLIRSLGQVATDLPRIMRDEKSTAFARFDRVEAFEAHMREMSGLPARLEELSRLLDRSLQVEGAVSHLSRIFRALNNVRPDPDVADMSAPDSPPVPAPSAIPKPPEPGPVPPPAAQSLSGADHPRVAPSAPDGLSTDPATGNVVRENKSHPIYRPIDLNLDRVRDAIVPGGMICGRSMYESSQARLVTARSGGEGPWRFQFRVGSLEWAAEAEGRGLRGVAALLCGDRGYVQVPARLLLEFLSGHEMRSTKGNRIIRPSVAVYRSEAILHPGAMARTRPGEATKHVFVEF